MATIKISELPAADSPVAPSDVVPALQNGVTKKAAIEQFGYAPGLANSVTRTIQNKLRDSVSVKDFGAVGDGVADDTLAIQNAINSGAASIYFPKGEYIITSPLYLDGSQTLHGDGFDTSRIRKGTTTTGTGSNLSRNGTVTDSYAVNAIFILRHPDNGYTYNVKIESLSLESIGYTVEYGIYAPRVTHLYLNQVQVYQCKIGFLTYDGWFNTFILTEFNCNTFRAFGNNYGWASGSKGIVFANDGTNGPTGTTLNASGTWARDCHVGWDIYGLQYSALTNCAADNICEAAYTFILSDMTLNGCGMEAIQIVNHAILVANGSCVFNGMRGFKIRGNPNSANSGYLFIDAFARVTFNNCQFDDWEPTYAGLSMNIVVQDGSRVFFNQTGLPSSGNQFVSYSNNSSTLVYSGQDFYLLDATANKTRRYIKGYVNDDNAIQAGADKAIASGGTVIATFTASNISNNPAYAVVPIELAWYDNSFPTSYGYAELQVVVNVDYSFGPTYRDSVNVSVNAYAGNGATAAPSFTLSRVNDVWSLTMTPADGACTVSYRIAQPKPKVNVAVALP